MATIISQVTIDEGVEQNLLNSNCKRLIIGGDCFINSHRNFSITIWDLEPYLTIRINLEFVVRPREISEFLVYAGDKREKIKVEVSNIENVAFCGTEREERIINHEIFIESSGFNTLSLSFSKVQESIPGDAFFGILSIKVAGASNCPTNSQKETDRCICKTGFYMNSNPECQRTPFLNSLCLKCEVCPGFSKGCTSKMGLSTPIDLICSDNFQLINGKCTMNKSIIIL
jgi:hypothetical protein